MKLKNTIQSKVVCEKCKIALPVVTIRDLAYCAPCGMDIMKKMDEPRPKRQYPWFR